MNLCVPCGQRFRHRASWAQHKFGTAAKSRRPKYIRRSPEYLPRSRDELFQRSDVLTIIARFVDGSLGDEGSVGQPRIIQKPPKALQANRSLPDVLVAIKFGTASAFGIVAMPDLHPLKPNSLVQVLQSLIEAGFADDVISGDVGVAGINARRGGNDPVQAVEDFRDLLKTSAERELGARGVLDENRESAFDQIEPLSRSRDCRSGTD